MKKKLFALFMLLALLPALSVWASAASIDIQVTPSKSQIAVGETVEYVVTATGEDVVAMQFELQFPDGLSYVPYSGATPTGLAQKLGVPAADWTEISSMFTFYNDIGITIKPGTEILRFSCKAEKAGTYDITLYELLPFDSNFEEFTPKVSITPLEVRSAQAQNANPPTLPAGTEPPATLPPATESQATVPVVTTPPVQPQATDPAVNVDPTVEMTTVPQEQPTVADPTDATEAAGEPTDPEATREPTQLGETTEQTQASDGNKEPTEEKKPSAAPWIILVIVAVAGAAAAVILILRKKKQL